MFEDVTEPKDDARGTQARQEAYEDLLKQGYVFRTNCNEFDVEDSIAECKVEGLNVVVEEKAFWDIGTLDPNLQAILVRKRQ